MTATTILQRPYAVHEPAWQRFQTSRILPAAGGSPQPTTTTTTKHEYQKQYSHIYHERLALLSPRCWESMQSVMESTDSSYVRVQRILDLQEHTDSCVVGTLVKEVTGADHDADDHARDRCHPAVPYVNKSDAIYLEDESGRVSLVMDQPHAYCSGCVLGVQGRLLPDGSFQVRQVHLPSPPPPQRPPLPAHPNNSSSNNNNNNTPSILFLSGLHFGDPSSSIPRDMLLSFLQGRFGTTKAATVCHVILAGGLLAAPSPPIHEVTTKTTIHTTITTNTNINNHTVISNKREALAELDWFLMQLTKGCGLPCDVIPGQDDPTTANWPQRPLHTALFPASRHSTLIHRTPNPYAATLGGYQIVGTNGYNILDIQKRILNTEHGSTAMESGERTDQDQTTTTTEPNYQPMTSLQVLQKTLEWCHLCPTAPDSLPMHPSGDPFVLETYPHLYFAGNMDRFATTTTTTTTKNNVASPTSTTNTTTTTTTPSSSPLTPPTETLSVATRLLCIPRFVDTGLAVLVHLDETLSVELLKFEDDDDDGH